MYTIGIAGIGYWGSNLLRTLVENPEVEHVIVYDVNEKALEKVREKYKDKVETTLSYDFLLNADKVTGILIATPPTSHYQLAIRALKSGKHVFVEKPITQREFEALILCEFAYKQKLTIMTGHTFCYVEAIQDIKRRISIGELGDIVYISWDQLNLGKFQLSGVIQDLAPHGISIAMYLLENPEILKVRCDVNKALTDYIDIAHIDIYTSVKGKQVLVHLTNSWIHPVKVRSLVVIGTKKMMVYDDITTQLQILDKHVEEVKQKVENSWGESKMNYVQGDIVIPQLKVVEPLKREIQEFIDCIKTGKEPLSGSKQILKVSEVLESLR